ncbi:MAG: hypothetical protein ACREPB_07000 [Arenimonas sp.]
MTNIPDNLSLVETWSAGEIAELWATLVEAAKTDAKARAFLVIFEPWAKNRLGTPS